MSLSLPVSLSLILNASLSIYLSLFISTSQIILPPPLFFSLCLSFYLSLALNSFSFTLYLVINLSFQQVSLLFCLRSSAATQYKGTSINIMIWKYGHSHFSHFNDKLSSYSTKMSLIIHPQKNQII